MIGILVVAIGVAFGANSAYAINPARDLGPRLLLLVSGCYGTSVFTAADYYFWIPIVSPLVGAVVGGGLFYTFIDLSDNPSASADESVPFGDGECIDVAGGKMKNSTRVLEDNSFATQGEDSFEEVVRAV